MGTFCVRGLLIGIAITMASCQDVANFQKQIVDASNKFALELYDVIKDNKEKSNLIISPLSLSTCMGMVYMMTNGSTAQELSDTMHFPQDHENAAVGFQQCLEGLDAEAFTWANNLFLRKDFQLKDSYTAVLNKHWGAAPESLDFTGDPKKSREHINEWVANKTNQTIRDLLPNGVPDSSSVMVLVSTLHFKRRWLPKFRNMSQKGDFHLADGKTIKVDKIIATSFSFGHKKMEDIKADVLKIPYKGEKQSMVIFHPFENDGLPALESHLKGMNWEDVFKSLSSSNMKVIMPKFKFQDSWQLRAPFEKLGMAKVFGTPSGDFSRAIDSGSLAVSEVFHKVMISVDEKGTEASAATGVSIGLTSAPIRPKELEIKRPFLFAIVENETGLITFLGRYTQPPQAN